MLFDLWQSAARAHPSRAALIDAATGGELTFAELQEQLDRQPAAQKGEVICAPIGAGVAAFVISTLRAWRDGAVFCPCESQPPSRELLAGLPEGIAHVKSTSGSTGEPRLVLFREEQLLADLENIRATMGLCVDHPNLAVISAAHSYGFSNLVLPLLLMGMPLWHLCNPLPETLRRVFQSGPRFTLPAVPAMWRAWQQAGVLHGAPVALAISAGAPLALGLEREIFEGTGIKVHNFYGSSECGGIAYDDSNQPRTDETYAGRAMDGVRVETGDDGCLIVRSRAVGECYWPRETDEDTKLGNGRFMTADLAEINQPRQEVFLRGRITDAINVAGRKVSPGEIEAALMASGQVRHCLVFGVPSEDPTRVEEIVACVNTLADTSPRSLSVLIASRLQTWQMPKQWWFTRELAPDARGKLPRAHWRNRYLENRRKGVAKNA